MEEVSEQVGTLARRKLVSTRVILALVVAVVLVLWMATGVAAEETFEVTPVPTGDEVGYISSDGDRVVWFEGDVFTMEYGSINTWTPTEGVTEIVSGGGLFEPQVSGDRIVWHGPASESGGESDVFTWTPDGVLQIEHSGWNDWAAKVDGDRIVWEGWPVPPPVIPLGAVYDSEIFTWTPPTPDGGGGIAQLTYNSVSDYQPDVSGDRVVWVQNEPDVPGWVGDIITMVVDDPTSLQQVDDPDNPYPSMEPKVSGDRVVWWGPDGPPAGVYELPDGQVITLSDPDGEIYTWTPASGRVQVTNDSSWDVVPGVDGDRVAWWHVDAEDLGVSADVYTWTPTEGIVFVETTNREINGPPQVSGDRLVWPGSVNTWTPGAGATEVSNTGSPIGYWNVGGDRLFWSTVDENGYMQIFTAVPAAQTTTATPASSAGGHKRYEQDDGLILYSGNWTKGGNDSLSGNSDTSTDDKTATITITFKGTRLDWIAASGPLMGRALISIDGGEPVLVDLLSDTELFQQLVWSTGTLEYGVHVIKITIPTDGGETKPINLDALDVWGALIATTES